jgi:hypothetical protein
MTSSAPRLPFSIDPLIAEANRRMRRRRLLVAAVVLVAIAAGAAMATRPPGNPAPSGSGGALSGPGRVGSVRIDPAGAIGSLQMNRSTAAQVIAFAGRPSVERRHHDRYVAYTVLGYGCAEGAGTQRYWASYPIACRTSFYLVDGRLSLFITQDPRFALAGGVRIGTPTARAEGVLHRRAFSGCNDAIGVQGKQTRLALPLAGGKLHVVGKKPYVDGGRVDGIYLHGRRDPGVTDCD